MIGAAALMPDDLESACAKPLSQDVSAELRDKARRIASKLEEARKHIQQFCAEVR